MITPFKLLGGRKFYFKFLLLTVFPWMIAAFLPGDREIKYSEVRIFLPSRESLHILAQHGLIITEAKIEKNSIVTVLKEEDMKLLKSSGFHYEILIDDVVAEYNRRPKLSQSELRSLEQQMKRIYDIEGFGFGSMGGFYTLNEIYQKMDSMHLLYPHLTTAKDSIGRTIENRPIYAMKISTNPNVNDPTKPEVFYNALTHAREPQGMMAVLYFMFYLLEKYGIDPEVTYLLNHRQLWFAPCLNPDGYFYNQTTNPNGGGQWRKNRRNNGGSYGVDLNRNFAYRWGYDNSGSSPTPSSETYRGTAPASEPETQAVQNFCNTHLFKTALNYHTYSNLLIYPWGYINQTTNDSVRFTRYAMDMTQYNGYTYGTPGQLLYPVNGGADDWMYGNDSMGHPKILAMTPEVGSSGDGFWPIQSRIFPLAHENLLPNLYIAWVAGKHPRIADVRTNQNTYQPGDSGQIRIALQNNGMDVNVNVAYELTTPHDGITFYNATGSVTQTQFREIDTIIIPFRLSNSIPSICAFSNQLTLVLDGVPVVLQTVNLFVGNVPLFADDAESDANNWTTAGSTNGTWGKTSAQFYSPSNSFTDSPAGSYLNNATALLTLSGNMNCSNISKAVLSFYQRYATESGYDFCHVELSTNAGTSWITLDQFSGSNLNWHERRYDISTLVAGKPNVKIRFKLTTDGSQTADGWYVDDIRIYGYPNAPFIAVNDNDLQTNHFSLFQNFPNPFNPTTTIKYDLKESGKVMLKIYNILGQEVRTLFQGYQKAGSYTVMWDGKNEHGQSVSSGIYFYRLNTHAGTQTRKMTLIR